MQEGGPRRAWWPHTVGSQTWGHDHCDLPTIVDNVLLPKMMSFGLTSNAESFVNEFRSRVEVHTHVKGRRVMSFNAMVGDIHSLIVLCTTPPFALRAVEDVRNPKLYKFLAVCSNVPERILLKLVKFYTSHKMKCKIIYHILWHYPCMVI